MNPQTSIFIKKVIINFNQIQSLQIKIYILFKIYQIIANFHFFETIIKIHTKFKIHVLYFNLIVILSQNCLKKLIRFLISSLNNVQLIVE